MRDSEDDFDDTTGDNYKEMIEEHLKKIGEILINFVIGEIPETREEYFLLNPEAKEVNIPLEKIGVLLESDELHLLDFDYEERFVDPPTFYAWTDKSVLFLQNNDGLILLHSVPRNPTEGNPAFKGYS